MNCFTRTSSVRVYHFATSAQLTLSDYSLFFAVELRELNDEIEVVGCGTVDGKQFLAFDTFMNNSPFAIFLQNTSRCHESAAV